MATSKWQGQRVAPIQSDTITLTIITAGVVESQVVTFPVPYSSAPNVQVTAHSAAPDQVDVSTDDPTTTQVTIYGVRSVGTTNLKITWTAFPSS